MSSYKRTDAGNLADNTGSNTVPTGGYSVRSRAGPALPWTPMSPSLGDG